VLRSGTHSISVAHALTRLNALHKQFFALPSRVGEEAPGARY
jgi:hypothetical protein